MKTIKIGVNKQGERLAITVDFNGHDVWIEKENYSRTSPSGTVKTWKCVKKNMALEDAEKLFNKRTKV